MWRVRPWAGCGDMWSPRLEIQSAQATERDALGGGKQQSPQTPPPGDLKYLQTPMHTDKPSTWRSTLRELAIQ